jgi:uncharacterized protein (DUF1778 family)
MAVATRTASLDLRVTQEQKDLIREAAAMRGKSITEFVMETVEPTAKALVEQEHQIELSRTAWKAFVKLMQSDAKATDLAKREAREYVAEFGMPQLPD